MAAFALGIATPAAADELVSNVQHHKWGCGDFWAYDWRQGQPAYDNSGRPIRVKMATGFTTGSHSTGYTLNSIDLPMQEPGQITVQLATGLVEGAGGYTVVATLISPPRSTSYQVVRLTAPAGTVLDANTKYWVVAAAPGPKPPPDQTQPGIGCTNSNAETGKFGWSIDDKGLWSGRSGRWATSITSHGVMAMRVNGTERTSSQPVLTVSGGSAVTEGTAASFTVTSDRAPSNPLTVNLTVSEPTGSDYVVSSEEGSKTVTLPANATTATYSVATQANSAVEPHGSVTVRVATGTGYTVGTNSGASVAVREATPPPLPVTGLTASYSNASAVDLTWTLATQPAGVTVTGIAVQRRSRSSWTTVASLGANATSHTVSGLTTGTSYAFRVRVVANHGSAYSETVSMIALAPPKPATGLTVSNVTGTTVDLSWTLPEQGVGVVVSRVEVHTAPRRYWDSEFERQDGYYWSSELAADATSSKMGVFHGGRIYDFRVRIFTNTGFADSEVVSWSSSLPSPKRITNLSFSNRTATSFDLSWTLPEQGEGVVVSAVEVEWGKNSYGLSTTPSTETATLAADAVSHTVTGLSPSTAYDFRVRLVANSGYSEEVEWEKWTAAAVSGVAVVSDAGSDDTHALGEAIRIRVSFTGGDHHDYPRVYTSGGVPRLKIDMGGGTRWATYESGGMGEQAT